MSSSSRTPSPHPPLGEPRQNNEPKEKVNSTLSHVRLTADAKSHVLSLPALSTAPSPVGGKDIQGGPVHGTTPDGMLHSVGGYGWYEEDNVSPANSGDEHGEEDGGGGDIKHVRVLSRMETLRVDVLDASMPGGTGHGGLQIDEAGGVTDEYERLLPRVPICRHDSVNEEGSLGRSKSTRMDADTTTMSYSHAADGTRRQHWHRQREGEILFHLPQSNFSVMTRQFLEEAAALSGTVGGGFPGRATHCFHHRHPRVLQLHSHHRSYSKRQPEVVYAALGLGGFRICQTGWGSQHAEYLVCLCINQQTFIAWRRYSAFAKFFRDIQRVYWDAADMFPATRGAWKALERRRKWWRCLSVGYLALKLGLLESFLEAVLVEVPGPDLLMAFASPSPSTTICDGLWSCPCAREMDDQGTWGANGITHISSNEEMLLCQKMQEVGQFRAIKSGCDTVAREEK